MSAGPAEVAWIDAHVARRGRWVRALYAAYELAPDEPDWATAPSETLARLLQDHYLA